MAVKKQPKGRAVKCYATGEKGTSLTFYKAPDGHYYKSEAVYQDKIHKTALHKQLMSTLADIMMFNPSMAFPTVVPKMLKEFSFYGDEIVLQTVEECRDKIEFAMRSKTFTSEYNRAAYVMAILKNNINDVYKAAKWKAESNAKQQRLVQDAQAPVVDDFSTMQQIGCTAKARDISEFLFDEE